MAYSTEFWYMLQYEYETSNITIGALSKKYQMHERTVAYQAKKNNWKKRKDLSGQHVKEFVDNSLLRTEVDEKEQELVQKLGENTKNQSEIREAVELFNTKQANTIILANGYKVLAKINDALSKSYIVKDDAEALKAYADALKTTTLVIKIIQAGMLDTPQK